MKIKICGMRDPGNIREISGLMPDYMGFIYYPRSGRYAGTLTVSWISDLPETIRKVGVFVNSSENDVLDICSKMGFRIVQLHGDESPEFCQSVKENGLQVIKAFGISSIESLKGMEAYQETCDIFLFDTASGDFGGTGKQFNWNLLDNYRCEIPFILSGGIGPSDVQGIMNIKHPQFFGVDLNSRFETEPGIKDGEELEVFIRKIRGN